MDSDRQMAGNAFSTFVYNFHIDVCVELEERVQSTDGTLNSAAVNLNWS